MLLTKPNHFKYVFHYLNNSKSSNYAKDYSSAKRKLQQFVCLLVVEH